MNKAVDISYQPRTMEINALPSVTGATLRIAFGNVHITTELSSAEVLELIGNLTSWRGGGAIHTKAVLRGFTYPVKHFQRGHYVLFDETTLCPPIKS